MAMTLKGRSFLTLKDFTKDEILYLVDLAAELKAKKKGKAHSSNVDGKLLGQRNLPPFIRWSKTICGALG